MNRAQLIFEAIWRVNLVFGYPRWQKHLDRLQQPFLPVWQPFLPARLNALPGHPPATPFADQDPPYADRRSS